MTARQPLSVRPDAARAADATRISAPVNRHRDGRFAAGIDLTALLAGVAEVAVAAAGGNPQRARRVSKAVFDAARTVAGGGLPAAETIRQRVGLPWPDILECALLPVGRRSSYLTRRQNGPARRNFNDATDERAITTLQAVAHRLAPGQLLTQIGYDEQVRAMELESRRWRQTTPLRLPRSVFVLDRFGQDWAAALAAAGLVNLLQPIHSTARCETPVHVTLERALDELGVIPTHGYFVRWCRANAISIPRARRWTWDVALRDLRDSRRQRGLETPALVTSGNDLPSLAAPRVKDRRIYHSRADVLASLRRYADLHLKPGDLPRQKDYLAAASADPQLIAASVLGRHGFFAQLCIDAGIS